LNDLVWLDLPIGLDGGRFKEIIICDIIMEWLKSLRLGGSKRTKQTKRTKTKRTRRAGGPEPDQTIGVKTSSTGTSKPQPQPNSYLSAVVPFAFPGLTAAAMSAQLLRDQKRKGGKLKKLSLK